MTLFSKPPHFAASTPPPPDLGVGTYSSDQYSVSGKTTLAIAAMNLQLPPFKNGERNSESASIIARVMTPLTTVFQLRS